MTYSGYRDHRETAKARITKVSDPNQAWLDQQPHWVLLDALIGGTYEMREKHRRYLPQEPRETDESYDTRLYRSCLSPLYTRIERMLAGMLTRKPIRLNDVSNDIREDLFDVDMLGNDVNIFAFNISKQLLRYGHIGVLVDAPPEGEGGRPYWVPYSPKDIIGWRTEKKEGREELVQLRLVERVIEPDGLYGEKEVKQVRLLTPGGYEIHRKDKEKSDWILHEEGSTSLDSIPFSVAYANRVGLLESRPPMEDLAELNLRHYQVSSDLGNILHISAVPFLTISGYPASAEEITAGPGEALALPEGASASYVEPAGGSFDAQYKQIEHIEKQVNELGLAAVLGRKLGAETAQSKAIDRSQGDSQLMACAQQLQDLIDNSLRFHAAYLGDGNPGSCYVNRDFLAQRLDPQEIGSLLQLYTAGTISQETLLTQLQSGEVLPDEFLIEEELEATAAVGMVDMNEPEDTEETEED